MTFLTMTLVLLALAKPRSCLCMHPHIDVPHAWNTAPLRPGPIVYVDRDTVSIDGIEVARRNAILAGLPDALDDFLAHLKNRRDLCRQLYRECVDPTVVFEVDRDADMGTVLALAASASAAGYVHHDYAVERWVAMAPL